MMLIKPTTNIIALLAFIFVSCQKSSFVKNDPLSKTIFRIGFKTDSSSTGPLSNSAFAIKINADLPPLLLTAHHVVAGTHDGQVVKWNEVETNMKNGWVWSMHDQSYNFKLGQNLPIRDAETLKFDLAAFRLPDSISYLRPSGKTAEVGDTVYLFTMLNASAKSSLFNEAVVIYATDSVMVYELNEVNGARSGVMSGTSGSCVINKSHEVVSNSYAGFSIPNEGVKREIAS